MHFISTHLACVRTLGTQSAKGNNFNVETAVVVLKVVKCLGLSELTPSKFFVIPSLSLNFETKVFRFQAPRNYDDVVPQ